MTTETWGVRGSEEPDVVEGIYPTVTEALRAAVESGQDVYLHADDCSTDRPLGADCPCRPFRIPARRKVLL